MTVALAVYTGLLLARCGAFVAALPLFAGRTPRTVRVGLAFALVLFYLGTVPPTWDGNFAAKLGSVPTLAYGLALIRESLIGGVVGVMFSLFLLPARVAGEFVTQQVGLALSPQAGLANDTPASPLALAFEAAASLAFLTLDGHHIALGTLHASFARLPLGGSLLPQPAVPLLDGMASAHEMGILLAAPLGLSLFLLTVVMALMARAAPQLNIYSVGFTLQVLVALLGALFLLPEFVQVASAMMGQVGDMVPRALW